MTLQLRVRCVAPPKALGPAATLPCQDAMFACLSALQLSNVSGALHVVRYMSPVEMLCCWQLHPLCRGNALLVSNPSACCTLVLGRVVDSHMFTVCLSA